MGGMKAQLDLRRRALAAGDRPLGWKVGFGAPAAMKSLGIEAPLIGYMTEASRVPPGGTVSLAGWAKPVAEPEVAVYLGRDLPGGADAGRAAAAIAALGPAIELADLDKPPQDVTAILAGNIYHRRVILGPGDAGRAGGDCSGLCGRVFRRGHEIATVDAVETNTGNLVAIVAHVANLLAAVGERLRADEIIICGSITPPLFLEADETEVEYELEPAGDIAVKFTR